MDIFDLEQEIMKAWGVVDDLKDAVHFLHTWPNNDEENRDKLLLGMAAIYQMRFERLWENFESVARDYHDIRRQNNS